MYKDTPNISLQSGKPDYYENHHHEIDEKKHLDDEII